MRYTPRGFTVTIQGQDWTYSPFEDIDDDCIKIWHDVVAPNGAHTSLPWSPYSYVTVDQFTRWVELGCPRPMFNNFPRNLTPEDLK